MSRSASVSIGFCDPDEIRWSVLAARDQELICERIETDDPEAACRVARRIYEGCARLKDFPDLGRTSIRMRGRRELIFAPLPYIAVYEARGGVIEISRIVHGAQDWS
jgi:toxin ParE1/3/4